MGNSEPKAEGSQWATAAEERLASVTEAVRALRQAFEAGTEPSLSDGTDLATSVQEACAALSAWIATSAAPRGLRKAGAELGAAAGVYRNAAVAFRSLAEREPGGGGALASACEAMLEQGDHHVRVFVSLVGKLTH